MSKERFFSKRTAAILLVCVMCAMCVMTLTGCGKNSIKGHWVLTREEYSDGRIQNADDIKDRGHGEEYIITKDCVRFIVRGGPLDGAAVDNTYESAEDGGYVFIFEDVIYAKVHRDGDYLVTVVEMEQGAKTSYYEKVD